MDFNLRFLNRYAYFDFIQFDYDNESSMDKYIYETIKDSEYIYAIPLVFSNDDFRTILHDYSPSVIAKLVSNINNYNRIFGSHVADYTGSFLVFSEDFSYFCIINNGHYICRFHNVRDIYINNSCEYINIEMYDYDKIFYLNYIISISKAVRINSSNFYSEKYNRQKVLVANEHNHRSTIRVINNVQPE